MDRFKIAVIGAGDMGGNHVRGWISAGHHVVSVTDTDKIRADKLALRYNVGAVYGDYKEAIDDPQVDIVSVCLPLVLHAPVTVYAAGRGKHIFCEKPLASSREAAEDMQRAVELAGVRFGIGFQRNFSEGVGLVRQWADEGRFGSPLVFSSDLMQEVRPKIAMHDARGNQGPVVDACCHYFLMWQTVFGSKPKKVYASGRILGKDRPEIAHFEELAVDTAVITVEYESGDIGTMNVSWGLAKKSPIRGRPDRIYGPKGGAEGPFNSFGRSTVSFELYEGSSTATVTVEQPDLFSKQFTIFAEAVREGKPAPVGFRQGLDMLRLSHAVLESAKTGNIVHLD
ncbi:Gfo/Idh/MocA family protein [Paenibacillus ginsengarvi]|uniref:Gfo/Idh/MocA family oxidoreductase n=1 Tax=Paenibacillus ginsengarvi TaxID=400777 RepID=A0A3B0CTY5_9BACL|nr:Gfo/Idh/MocA family oxidoreductase [Paenibacillus ginsengarvi]RKN86126.1 gfo/Idh/MocA family oxidoreductase [Paenibacillus ginsengarvi]